VASAVSDPRSCGGLRTSLNGMISSAGANQSQDNSAEALPPPLEDKAGGESTSSPLANDPEIQPEDLTLPQDNATPSNPWRTAPKDGSTAVPDAEGSSSPPTAPGPNADTGQSNSTSTSHDRAPINGSRPIPPKAEPKSPPAPIDVKPLPAAEKPGTDTTRDSRPAHGDVGKSASGSDQVRRASDEESVPPIEQKDASGPELSSSPHLTPRVRSAAKVLFYP
jgi:hypothetical protein